MLSIIKYIGKYTIFSGMILLLSLLSAQAQDVVQQVAVNNTGNCKAEEPVLQSNHALDADSLRANIRDKIQRLAQREQCLINYQVGRDDDLFYRDESPSAILVPIQSYIVQPD